MNDAEHLYGDVIWALVIGAGLIVAAISRRETGLRRVLWAMLSAALIILAAAIFFDVPGFLEGAP